ncbi:MAG TPA: prepilin-type N-terminal cleavage/methylation domain-containing protein [Verrucomicrobiae bacterium]|jgi:prepilin-type N-terminal cleavage/methylation domain-containing protein|nr:prepilin-type N-terminal cleavage/methylation domain-containing protein [Verrucomicrobiae bacterium]
MKCQRSNAGFSLVEVMVAILILGVALAGMTRGITTALASNKDSELVTVAALAAAAQIETIRADATWTDGETDGECGDDLPGYKWTQTIKASDVDGLHEVSVSVQKGNSSAPIYELKTLLFDPDSIATTEDATTKKDREREKKKHQSRQ